MKQFNIEEYKKNPSRKVITRDGRSVRIVCTDVMGAIYPVLAVYKKVLLMKIGILIRLMEDFTQKETQIAIYSLLQKRKRVGLIY